MLSTVNSTEECVIEFSDSLTCGMRRHLAEFQHVVIVFDANTAKFQEEVSSVTQGLGLRTDCVILNSFGEACKSLDQYLALIGQIAERDFLRRRSCLIAVGGGCVSDLVGYVAATYQRGVAYINVPTTLLAMTDASIGGKVAINLREGKNLLGAFHCPRAVLIDISKLETLPQRVFAAGFAEVLKVALISGNARLFEFVENHSAQAVARDRDTLIEMISESVHVKLGLVEPDWRENQLDRLLNLGHEVAHALEAAIAYDDETLMHGESVALGLMVSVQLARERDLLTAALSSRITNLIARLCHLVPIDGRVDREALSANLKTIEQIRDGKLRVVLPCGEIGHASVFHNISANDVELALTQVNDSVSPQMRSFRNMVLVGRQ